MPTIWKTGAIRNARKVVNETNPPSVRSPAMMARAPKNMTPDPTTPNNTVAERLITEIAVSDFSTLSSNLVTPFANTSCSRPSA